MSSGITSIELSEDARRLTLHMADSSTAVLGACTLRDNAKDAVARRARLSGEAAAAPADLQITGIDAMGASAVNIRFSDGHDRAIYPFQYLVKLARPLTSDHTSETPSRLAAQPEQTNG